MIYLKEFSLASSGAEASLFSNPKARMSTMGVWYPFSIFPEKGLEKLEFNSPITIYNTPRNRTAGRKNNEFVLDWSRSKNGQK